MRSWQRLVVVFGVACGGAVVATVDLAADDTKKLEGTWVLESTSRDKELAVDWKGGKCVFRRDSATLTLPRDEEQRFTFTVDSAAEPKAMDFTPKKAKQAPWRMIYELEGDSMRLCIGDSKRPTEFSDKQGLVVILKRKK